MELYEWPIHPVAIFDHPCIMTDITCYTIPVSLTLKQLERSLPSLVSCAPSCCT